MDTVLRQLLEKVDEYIASLIDVAAMPADDKAMLKSHLLAAQDILARNGQRELCDFVKGIMAAVLSRF